MAGGFLKITKVRECINCKKEFVAKMKIGGWGWQDYCKECVGRKVWYGKKGRV